MTGEVQHSADVNGSYFAPGLENLVPFPDEIIGRYMTKPTQKVFDQRASQPIESAHGDALF